MKVVTRGADLDDNRLTAVQVRTEPDFALFGEREVLFESDAFFTFHYDVDRDGRRFLMVEASAEELLEDRTWCWCLIPHKEMAAFRRPLIGSTGSGT